MSLAYMASITTNMNVSTTNALPSVNNAASIAAGSFNRIGYYMGSRVPSSGSLQWVYASFNASAFQTDPTKIGIPTVANGEFYHYTAAGTFPGTVTNMNVLSDVAGVVTGTGIATGQRPVLAQQLQHG